MGCTGEAGLLSGPGGGTRGGQTTPNPLIGEWETTLVVQVASTIQLWTTRWTFEADGTCRFRRTVTDPLLGGVILTRLRDCRWSAANAVLTVTFGDTGERLDAPYSFPGGRRDRLLLEGIEYRRQG